MDGLGIQDPMCPTATTESCKCGRTVTQVLNKTGPNCYNDKIMPYFKMGIYKSNWRDDVGDVVERTVYHDEVRIAGKNGSYSAVAPRGGQ